MPAVHPDCLFGAQVSLCKLRANLRWQTWMQNCHKNHLFALLQSVRSRTLLTLVAHSVASGGHGRFGVFVVATPRLVVLLSLVSDLAMVTTHYLVPTYFNLRHSRSK
jgi:hypothetical protein